MKYKSEAFLLSLGILSFPITSAHASTVQNLSASEAETGLSPIINVCPVQGYNLNFLQMKGGIVQAKLVDPSRTHITFDVERPSHQTPAKVVYLRHINQLKFNGLPSAKKGQHTTLSVLTTARKLYRFRVAFGCPSRFDTGIVKGPIASARRSRFKRPSAPESPQPLPNNDNNSLDPVVPKPKAKISGARRYEPAQQPLKNSASQPKAQLTPSKGTVQLEGHPETIRADFSNQLVIEGNFTSLFGLPTAQEPFPKTEAKDSTQPSDEVNDEVGLVPSAPIEVEYAPGHEPPTAQQKNQPAPSQVKLIRQPKPEVELSSSKIAWHLNRGLHIAKNKGEINYGTGTYKKWQSVIALVRRGNSLESAIKRTNTNPKVGATLLSYGGLK